MDKGLPSALCFSVSVRGESVGTGLPEGLAI